jgi:hypothetical protein
LKKQGLCVGGLSAAAEKIGMGQNSEQNDEWSVATKAKSGN